LFALPESFRSQEVGICLPAVLSSRNMFMAVLVKKGKQAFINSCRTLDSYLYSLAGRI
jgi:hypothetical protein